MRHGRVMTCVLAAQTLNSTPLVFVVYSTSHRFWKSLLHIVSPDACHSPVSCTRCCEETPLLIKSTTEWPCSAARPIATVQTSVRNTPLVSSSPSRAASHAFSSPPRSALAQPGRYLTGAVARRADQYSMTCSWAASGRCGPARRVGTSPRLCTGRARDCGGHGTGRRMRLRERSCRSRARRAALRRSGTSPRPRTGRTLGSWRAWRWRWRARRGASARSPSRAGGATTTARWRPCRT